MTITHLRSGVRDCDVEMVVEWDVHSEKAEMVVESACSEEQGLEKNVFVS